VLLCSVLNQFSVYNESEQFPNHSLIPTVRNSNDMAVPNIRKAFLASLTLIKSPHKGVQPGPYMCCPWAWTVLFF